MCAMMNDSKNDSVTSCIQHFLNEEGLTFYKDWLRRAHFILSQQRGFCNLEILSRPEINGVLEIAVSFKTMDSLSAWANSDTHRELLVDIEKVSVSPCKIHRQPSS